AEVWRILDGIFILLNNGFRRAIIQTKNFKVAQILSDLGLEDLGITGLRRTQCIMSLNWKSTLQVFDEVPKEILDLLQEDKDNGVELLHTKRESVEEDDHYSSLGQVFKALSKAISSFEFQLPFITASFSSLILIQSRVVGLFDGIRDSGANANTDVISSEGMRGEWAEEKGESEPKEEGFEGFGFNGEEGQGEDNGRD
ncbi:hypothetical protein Godav_013489, partial [Gossypium davidsonii]|nr:hypothetical protein [Gossypium davidsonii]